MAIYLPGPVDESPALDELSSREIVVELDKHVVGQNDAKRSVAIALRNRIRRQKASRPRVVARPSGTGMLPVPVFWCRV